MRQVENEKVVWLEVEDVSVLIETLREKDPAHADDLFVVEGFESDNDHCGIMNLAEVIDWYNEWDQEEEEEDMRYESVWDYLMDAIGEGIHPVSVID